MRNKKKKIVYEAYSCKYYTVGILVVQLLECFKCTAKQQSSIHFLLKL